MTFRYLLLTFLISFRCYETDGRWDQQDLDEWWIVAEQEKCRNRFVREKWYFSGVAETEWDWDNILWNNVTTMKTGEWSND